MNVYYQEGYDAFADETTTEHDCPYSEGTFPYSEWQRGFWQANEDCLNA